MLRLESFLFCILSITFLQSSTLDEQLDSKFRQHIQQPFDNWTHNTDLIFWRGAFNESNEQISEPFSADNSNSENFDLNSIENVDDEELNLHIPYPNDILARQICI